MGLVGGVGLLRSEFSRLFVCLFVCVIVFLVDN